jgi:hypothetical protein
MSLIGGMMGSSAASDAANAQAKASMYAADKQQQEADASLGFQKQQYSDAQTRSQPWLQAGTSAINQLSNSLTSGDLSKQWTGQFQAPTNVTEQNDPGYQFRLQQGQQALERSAAARGGVLSGGAVKAAQRYGQDYSSNEYGNVYNRALGEYQMGYNQFQNNQANEFNRLAAVSGIGQTAGSQLNAQGQSAAQNVGNINMTAGQQIGQDYMNAGQASAAGSINSANAWGGALNGLAGAGYMATNPYGGQQANYGGLMGGATGMDPRAAYYPSGNSGDI